MAQGCFWVSGIPHLGLSPDCKTGGRNSFWPQKPRAVSEFDGLGSQKVQSSRALDEHLLWDVSKTTHAAVDRRIAS